MRKLKNLIALSAVMAMVASSVNAQEYVSAEVAGCGYEECRRSPSLTPAIALGAIALVAIIAVAVQNSGHSHHHHSHL